MYYGDIQEEIEREVDKVLASDLSPEKMEVILDKLYEEQIQTSTTTSESEA